MKISCIIPTYNEKENLGEIFQELKRLSLPDYEVLFIDDTSPDGTGEIIAEEARKNSKIRLISREGKQGLGSAYFRGFCEAQGDILIGLEADFPSGIRYIPKMLEQIRSGAGQVICSRHVRGSENHLKFPKKQGGYILNSLAASYLGVPAKDLFIAIRAIKADYFNKIKNKVNHFGHPGFFAQLTYLLHKAGARTIEIPVVFEARAHGESKNINMFSTALKFLFKLPGIKRSW